MSKKDGLKDECLKCGTFDPKQRQHYKCAVPGSCPGRDWPMSKRQRIIKGRKKP